MDGSSPFGRLLRDLRVRQGMSLARLSQLTHYSKGYLSRVENGHRPPSAQLASQCEAMLGAAGELAPLVARNGASSRGPFTRPAQLPADVANFTGRGAVMSQLDALAAGQAGSSAITIALLTGLPGVGKTALAVHWAHHAAIGFPDGALYATLRGHDPADVPARPADVLDGFLRALGAAPAMIPADVAGRSALLRTLLHSRKMLIVLDNVATPEQVRPLLPGSPGSFVVVTSRNRLTGLVARDGAQRFPIGPLPAGDATLLLRGILGRQRVAAEPGKAALIASRCAYLPLALRIAAERATANPEVRLSQLASELAAERGRLDALSAGDDVATAVRAVFSWSYAALSPAAARMFRLLGLPAAADFSVPAAAALAAVPPDHAAGLLDELAGAHLLEESAGETRYRFHDLLRTYASERARREEPETSRAAAIRRHVTWCLHTADSADRILMPLRRHLPLGPPPALCRPLTFTSYEEALAWCNAEQPNLVAAISQAAESGLHDGAWKLCVALWGFFALRRPADWIDAEHTGLASARLAGDPQAEAWLLGSLGTAHFCLHRFEDALDCYLNALAMDRKIGNQWGEGIVLNNLGELYWEFGRLDDALAVHQEAFALFRRSGNLRGEMITLDNLGATYRKLGRPADALPCLQRALVLFRDAGDRRGEGMARHNLAETYHQTGQFDEALSHYQQGLAIRRQADDKHGEAVTLRALGDVSANTGHPDKAHDYWRKALAIFEALNDPQAADLRATARSAP